MAEMDVNSFPTHLAEEEEMHLLEQGILGIAVSSAVQPEVQMKARCDADGAAETYAHGRPVYHAILGMIARGDAPKPAPERRKSAQ